MVKTLILSHIKLLKNISKDKYHSITIGNIDFPKFKINNLNFYRALNIIYN